MSSDTRGFCGWRVVHAAFVLAVFGWELGFYGPPIFLSVIRESRGWSLFVIAAAVSVHFFTGALTGANLPALHRRLSATCVTKIGALAMAAGIIGWAAASAPWQLFVAAMLSGAGWGTMSAAALNAIVSPWFARARPPRSAWRTTAAAWAGLFYRHCGWPPLAAADFCRRCRWLPLSWCLRCGYWPTGCFRARPRPWA